MSLEEHEARWLFGVLLPNARWRTPGGVARDLDGEVHAWVDKVEKSARTWSKLRSMAGTGDDISPWPLPLLVHLQRAVDAVGLEHGRPEDQARVAALVELLAWTTARHRPPMGVEEASRVVEILYAATVWRMMPEDLDDVKAAIARASEILGQTEGSPAARAWLDASTLRVHDPP